MRLLIFDLDGTIAHTALSVCRGVNVALREYGKPSVTQEEVAAAMGSGARMLITRLLPEGDRENGELIEEVLRRYEAAYEEICADAPLYEGMEETLRTLKERGYLLAVLSNKQDEYVRKMMSAYFEDGFFAHVQGQTSLPKKPDPTVPLMIAEALAVPPCECAFIGDSDVDVLTGKNAGMTAVGCAWGYRPYEVLAAHSPHKIVKHPRELLNIFD